MQEREAGGDDREGHHGRDEVVLRAGRLEYRHRRRARDDARPAGQRPRRAERPRDRRGRECQDDPRRVLHQARDALQVEPADVGSLQATSCQEPELVFAPEEEYVPVPEKITNVVTESVAAAGGAVSLSEDQLAAAISRISREIIEKIVWEVVPDLAEMLIKEEIRKIKTATGD